ncbi:menaquinone reductase integral membrane subunit QrcD [Thermodesulfobacteriota bacterium]
MDSSLMPEGVNRCSLPKFAFWQFVWAVLLAWGVIGAFLCLYKGLNQTGMNDYFGFGLWITFDLSVIALGAGAFFTGFLTYVLRQDDLKQIINAAVIIGFICYSGAVGMLGIDIGQPIRGWFGFWHANVHSMLVEVMFCITCYLTVLAIEYLPLILGNRKLDAVPEFHRFGHNLHHIVIVFACVGTFLSFFHQGSLGGMYGVLTGRPFLFRTGFSIWPWTFFLFILSAIASGPAFTTLVVFFAQKIGRKQLVERQVFSKMAKIAGILLTVYLVFKFADTIYWALSTSPKAGFSIMDFYREGSYGIILLILELGVFGVIPAIILLSPKARDNDFWLMVGCLMNCTGIVVNRFVLTVQGLAIPVMPFEKFLTYLPTWQEWSISIAMLAYGMLVFSLSYRYLPIFPKEKELNRA